MTKTVTRTVTVSAQSPLPSDRLSPPATGRHPGPPVASQVQAETRPDSPPVPAPPISSNLPPLRRSAENSGSVTWCLARAQLKESLKAIEAAQAEVLPRSLPAYAVFLQLARMVPSSLPPSIIPSLIHPTYCPSIGQRISGSATPASVGSY